MKKSLLYFLVGFTAASVVVWHRREERERLRAQAGKPAPRPGAAVDLAPDAGTVEATAGSTVNDPGDAPESSIF